MTSQITTTREVEQVTSQPGSAGGGYGPSEDGLRFSSLHTPFQPALGVTGAPTFKQPLGKQPFHAYQLGDVKTTLPTYLAREEAMKNPDVKVRRLVPAHASKGFARMLPYDSPASQMRNDNQIANAFIGLAVDSQTLFPEDYLRLRTFDPQLWRLYFQSSFLMIVENPQSLQTIHISKTPQLPYVISICLKGKDYAYYARDSVQPANIERISTLSRTYDAKYSNPNLVYTYNQLADTLNDNQCGTKEITSQVNRLSKLFTSLKEVDTAALSVAQSIRESKDQQESLDLGITSIPGLLRTLFSEVTYIDTIKHARPIGPSEMAHFSRFKYSALARPQDEGVTRYQYMDNQYNEIDITQPYLDVATLVQSDSVMINAKDTTMTREEVGYPIERTSPDPEDHALYKSKDRDLVHRASLFFESITHSDMMTVGAYKHLIDIGLAGYKIACSQEKAPVHIDYNSQNYTELFNDPRIKRMPGINPNSKAGPQLSGLPNQKQGSNLQLIYDRAQITLELCREPARTSQRLRIKQLLENGQLQLSDDIREAVDKNLLLSDNALYNMHMGECFVNMIPKDEIISRAALKYTRIVCSPDTAFHLPVAVFFSDQVGRMKTYPDNDCLLNYKLAKGGISTLFKNLIAQGMANTVVQQIDGKTVGKKPYSQPLIYSDNVYLAVYSDSHINFISFDAKAAETSVETTFVQHVYQNAYLTHKRKSQTPIFADHANFESTHPQDISLRTELPQLKPEPDGFQRYLSLASNFVSKLLGLVGKKALLFPAMASGVYPTAMLNTLQSARCVALLKQTQTLEQVLYTDPTTGKTDINPALWALVASTTGTNLTFENVARIPMDLFEMKSKSWDKSIKFYDFTDVRVWETDLLGNDLFQLRFHSDNTQILMCTGMMLSREKLNKAICFDKFEKQLTISVPKLETSFNEDLKMYLLKKANNVVLSDEEAKIFDVITKADVEIQKHKSSESNVTFRTVVRALIAHPKLTQLYTYGGWYYHRDAFRHWIFAYSQVIENFKNLAQYLLMAETSKNFISDNLSREDGLDVNTNYYDISVEDRYGWHPPSMLQVLRVMSDLNQVLPSQSEQVMRISDHIRKRQAEDQLAEVRSREVEELYMTYLGAYRNVSDLDNEDLQEAFIQAYASRFFIPLAPSTQMDNLVELRMGIKFDVLHQAMRMVTQPGLSISDGTNLQGMFQSKAQNQYATLQDFYAYIRTYKGNFMKRFPKGEIKINSNLVEQHTIRDMEIYTSIAAQFSSAEQKSIVDTVKKYLDNVFTTAAKRLTNVTKDSKMNYIGREVVFQLIVYEQSLVMNAEGVPVYISNSLDKFQHRVTTLQTQGGINGLELKLAQLRKAEKDVTTSEESHNKTTLLRELQTKISAAQIEVESARVFLQNVYSIGSKVRGVNESEARFKARQTVTSQQIEAFYQRPNAVVNSKLPYTIGADASVLRRWFSVPASFGYLNVPRSLPLWIYPIINMQLTRLRNLASYATAFREPTKTIPDWIGRSKALFSGREGSVTVDILTPLDTQPQERFYSAGRFYYFFMQAIKYVSNSKLDYPKISPTDLPRALEHIGDEIPFTLVYELSEGVKHQAARSAAAKMQRQTTLLLHAVQTQKNLTDHLARLKLHAVDITKRTSRPLTGIEYVQQATGILVQAFTLAMASPFLKDVSTLTPSAMADVCEVYLAQAYKLHVLLCGQKAIQTSDGQVTTKDQQKLSMDPLAQLAVRALPDDDISGPSKQMINRNLIREITRVYCHELITAHLKTEDQTSTPSQHTFVNLALLQDSSLFILTQNKVTREFNHKPLTKALILTITGLRKSGWCTELGEALNRNVITNWTMKTAKTGQQLYARLLDDVKLMPEVFKKTKSTEAKVE